MINDFLIALFLSFRLICRQIPHLLFTPIFLSLCFFGGKSMGRENKQSISLQNLTTTTSSSLFNCRLLYRVADFGIDFPSTAAKQTKFFSDENFLIMRKTALIITVEMITLSNYSVTSTDLISFPVQSCRIFDLDSVLVHS